MLRTIIAIVSAALLIGIGQAKERNAERCVVPAAIWNDGSVTFDRPCFDAVLPARIAAIGADRIDAKAAEWKPDIRNPEQVTWAYAIWASRRTKPGASLYLPGDQK
jgi:hypothetical protein